MAVRQLLWRLGYRYRLYRKDLPGKPDIVFPGRKKVIFVHGCFWHSHDCKEGIRNPKSNTEYWLPKRARNIQKDIENQGSLQEAGWQVLVIWECQIKDSAQLKEIIHSFLD